MKKVLYVTIVSNQVGGGMSGLNRNLKLIKGVPNIDLHICQVQMQSKMSALYSALTGGNLILSYKDEKKIIDQIIAGQYDFVFQEGTTSGHLAESIAKTGTKLIVFGHNVETVLYQERAKTYKYNFLEQLKYLCVKRNEKKSVYYSSTLVGLTQRDSSTFRKFFGKCADVIIPVSSPSVTLKNIEKKEEYGLFVGSNFFPNNEGIEWFVKYVAPYINKKIKVVGTCCKTITYLPDELKDKVEVLGLVDDLSSVYEGASFVIVPLFKGSGMKTKTIEAMSYGKTIFGTDECFQGIECNYEKIGGLCNTDKQFIEKINSFNGALINDYVLKLFKENYSNEAVQEKFNKLFE